MNLQHLQSMPVFVIKKSSIFSFEFITEWCSHKFLLNHFYSTYWPLLIRQVKVCIWKPIFSTKLFRFSHFLSISPHTFPHLKRYCGLVFLFFHLPLSFNGLKLSEYSDIFYGSVFITSGRNMFIRSIYLSEIHLVEVVWRCVLIWSHKPRWRPPMSLFTSALLMACKSTHHVFKRRGKQFTK